jgi:hypothetical protein
MCFMPFKACAPLLTTCTTNHPTPCAQTALDSTHSLGAGLSKPVFLRRSCSSQCSAVHRRDFGLHALEGCSIRPLQALPGRPVHRTLVCRQLQQEPQPSLVHCLDGMLGRT